jgi:hypothetical protein
MLARPARSAKYFSVRNADSFSAHRHVDELVERHTLSLSHLAGLVEKRRLKPQREIALPHDLFSSWFTVSAEDSTSIQIAWSLG